jgi:hypothetical protein
MNANLCKCLMLKLSICRTCSGNREKGNIIYPIGIYIKIYTILDKARGDATMVYLQPVTYSPVMFTKTSLSESDLCWDLSESVIVIQMCRRIIYPLLYHPLHHSQTTYPYSSATYFSTSSLVTFSIVILHSQILWYDILSSSTYAHSQVTYLCRSSPVTFSYSNNIPSQLCGNIFSVYRR